jgi:hypothetical protein
MGVLQAGMGSAGFPLMHEHGRAFRFGTPASQIALKRNNAAAQRLSTTRGGFVVQTISSGR